MLETAIPDHLKQARTQPAKTPKNYEPPYPSYSARFPKSMKNLVMAVIGCQFPNAKSDTVKDAESILRTVLTFTGQSQANAPKFEDVASVIDPTGAYNMCVIAYWSDIASWEKWLTESEFETWWQGKVDSPPHDYGLFLEVFLPSIDRVETILSSSPYGASRMHETMSGPVQEHFYWGSSRDRFPVSQVDPLVGDKWMADKANQTSKKGDRHVRLTGKDNLIVIRSGQDWSETTPEERKLYEDTMHPVLVKGMDFLRDNGAEVGCYSCRLMDVLDFDRTFQGNTDRTFGLAYFDDLASLEKWSREHQTHLDIYNGFLKYAKKLENNISLRLWHEILVLKPEQQRFEYIGCHQQTGLLKSL